MFNLKYAIYVINGCQTLYRALHPHKWMSDPLQSAFTPVDPSEGVHLETIRLQPKLIQPNLTNVSAARAQIEIAKTSRIPRYWDERFGDNRGRRNQYTERVSAVDCCGQFAGYISDIVTRSRMLHGQKWMVVYWRREEGQSDGCRMLVWYGWDKRDYE